MAEEYVSLADLDLLEEELVGFRPEADANAALPPVSHGVYIARPYFANESDPGKIWQKKLGVKNDPMKVWYMAEVVIELTANGDETVNGRKLSYYPSTLVFKNSGTNGIQQLLQPLGYQDQLDELLSLTPTRRGGALMKMLTDALSGGQALIAVEWDWEASYYDKEKDVTPYRFRGMKKFPKDKDGNPIPSIDWPGNADYGAETLPARNYIRRFYPVNAVGGGDKLTADLEASVASASTASADKPAATPINKPAAPPVARPQAPQGPAAPRPPASAPHAAPASAHGATAGGPPVPKRATVATVTK